MSKKLSLSKETLRSISGRTMTQDEVTLVGGAATLVGCGTQPSNAGSCGCNSFSGCAGSTGCNSVTDNCQMR